jgi:hypothetical protein
MVIILEFWPKLQHASMPSNPEESPSSYSSRIMGAAIFDWNGLPKEYFTTEENGEIGWVQTVFQVLGLRSLLMSSLRLEGFHHASVCSDAYYAIILKQRDNYVALLINAQGLTGITPDFLAWAQAFDYTRLSGDARFQRA